MHYEPRSQISRVIATAALTLVTLIGCSCSRGARVARLLDQANRHFEAGELEKAEIGYKNALQKDAANTHAIAQLGVLYHTQGRDLRAAAYLLKARELQPDNLDVRQRLALIQLSSGAAKEAREEALFVLQRRPADEQASLILVEASTTPSELADAGQRLQTLPPPAAGSPPVLVALGNVALRQNRVRDAETAFKQALAADPKSIAAQGALGMLRWGQRDLAAADAAFKLAAELSPPRSPRRIYYAQFKLQTGDADAAKKILDEITRRAPDYFSAWLWRAEIALKEKKLGDADAFVARALAQEAQHPEAVLINARIRLAKGEHDKAIADLESLQTAFPKSIPVAYQLGLAYNAAGDINKAITRLTQVTSAAPEMADAALALAEIHLRKRDFAAAIAVLRPVVQPRDAMQARVLLAEAYRGQGNLEEAAAIYAELEKQRPTEAGVAFARGTVLLQQGRRAEARAQFEKTRRLQPEHFPALEQLVDLELRDKNHDAARRLAEAELARHGASAPHALLLAKVCEAADDVAAAETALKKALELQPTSTPALYFLARLYESSQQRDKALANLRESARLNPQSLAPHLLLGVLLEKQKDFAAARDAYEKALAIDPKNSLALNNLACLYNDPLDQPDRALELAQRVRAILPNEPRSADTLGWALARRKNYTQALAPLQESAGRLPDEPEVQYHLGFVHYMLGDEPAARAALRRAIEPAVNFSGVDDARERLALLSIDPATVTAADRAMLVKRLANRPDDPAARLRAGEFERRQGDTAKALTHFNAILQSNPKNAAALINIARIHAAKNEIPKALELAKAARNAAPDNPDIAHTVGRIAYDAGDHRWAASLLQEVVRNRPDDPDVLFDAAVAYYSVGRVADAEANARQAIAAPAFRRAAAAQRFADMLALAATPEQTVAAAAQIEEALRAEPSLAPALMARALAAEQRHDATAAGRLYEQLLSAYPDFTPAQRNLTLLYAARSSDPAKAAILAGKARQAFPGDALLARAAGIIAYRQSEFAKAAGLLQDAVAKNKQDAEALYYLGMTQSRLNKRSESKQSLQRALDAGLQETLAAEAKKTLARAD